MDTDLHQMIGRIDERTELMMKSMDDFKRLSESHDARISSLESDRTRAKGVILGISLGSGTIGAILSKVLPFGWH